MKKQSIAGLLICVTSLGLLAGCQALTTDKSTQAYQVDGNATPTMISDLIDLSDRLHFPEIEEASDILLNERGYISNITPTEENYYFSGSSSTVEDVKSNLTTEWDMKEKDKLIKLTMEFENQFETYGIDFDNSIEMVKINAQSNLPLVFVSNNAIVLTQTAVDMHKDNLKDELVMAYFKLYMSEHPELSDEMSEMIGFSILPGLNLPEELINHIIIRPSITKPYLYEARRADIETSPVYKWIPVTIVNPQTDRAEDYMLAVTLSSNGEAFVKTMSSTNKYLTKISAFNSMLAVPLTEIEDVYKSFGELPEIKSHPEDILALNFMYLVLERPITGTGTVDKLKIKLGS